MNKHKGVCDMIFVQGHKFNQKSLNSSYKEMIRNLMNLNIMAEQFGFVASTPNIQ